MLHVTAVGSAVTVTVMPASVARASKVWKAAGSIQSQVGKPTSWSASAGGARVGKHERHLVVDLPGDPRQVGPRLARLVLEQVGVEHLVVVEVRALEVVGGAGHHGIDRGQLIPHGPLRRELLDRHLPHLTPPRPQVGGRRGVGPRCDELRMADSGGRVGGVVTTVDRDVPKVVRLRIANRLSTGC
jgi:hypothetical protein